MLKRILSISGKPGLYRLVNQGKNMLIVESLSTGKRTPAYARDKVVSLGDISIYTTDGDVPLTDVLESVKVANDAKDIRKLFSWYNQLIAADVTDFKDNEIAEDNAAEAAEKADNADVK